MKKRDQDLALKLLIERLTAQYQPFTGFERHMVEFLAQCEARLERYARAERALIDHFAAEIVAQTPGISLDEARAAVTTGKEYAAKLKVLRKYQTNASQSCRRAARQLEEAIKMRKKLLPLEMPDLFTLQ